MGTPQRTAGPMHAGAAIAVLVLTAALAVPAAAGADAAATAAGAEVYKAQCIGCHGADGGAGTPIGKALKVQDLPRSEVQAMKDADLPAGIEKGAGKMPTFQV